MTSIVLLSPPCPELQQMKLSLWILACKAPYDVAPIFYKDQPWTSSHGFPPADPVFWLFQEHSRLVSTTAFFFISFFLFGCAGSSLPLGLFSTWDKQGQLSNWNGWASHCRAQTLGWEASVLVLHGLSSFDARALSSCGCTGLVALQRVESSRTREGTDVSCIVRQILYH